MAIRSGRDDAARFDADGLLFPLEAMPSEEAARLAEDVAVPVVAGTGLPAYANIKPHLLFPRLWDIVHDARIVDVVETLLGPDLLCWGSSFIAKPARSGRFVAWHQDATYWGLSAPVAVTAWIALSPSTAESGCVRAIPGSHRVQLRHANSGDPENMLGAGERLAAEVETAAAVDLVLAPGEMSLHHVLLVHGSSPNRSSRPRIGFAIRFVPGSIGRAPGPATTATLVRGRDHGRFERELAPRTALDPDAVARHPTIVGRGAKLIMHQRRKHLAAERAAGSVGPGASVP